MKSFTSLIAALVVTGMLSSSAMAHDWKLGIGMRHNPGGGVRIVEVFPNSPAEDARLRPGMILLSVNGIRFNSPLAVRDFIMNDHSDQLVLRIVINGWVYDYVADVVTVSAVVTEGSNSAGGPQPKNTLRLKQIKPIGPLRR